MDNISDQNPVKEGGVSPRLNFDTIGYAFITVFALLVNEDWNMTLYRYVRGNDNKLLAYLYILFVVIFGNFILLQLFLAIRINQFSKATEVAYER